MSFDGPLKTTMITPCDMATICVSVRFILAETEFTIGLIPLERMRYLYTSLAVGLDLET